MKDDKHVISDHYGVCANFSAVKNPTILEEPNITDPFVTFDRSFLSQGI